MSAPRKLAVLGAVLGAVLLGVVGQAVLGSHGSPLPWSVVGSSGNSSSSTNFELGSTAGQSSTIGESTSPNFGLGWGFWYGAACIGDSDGDSLGLGDPFGLFLRDCVEGFIGTLPTVACAATSTIDDEDPDALGPDWDDDQDVDGSDLFLFAERFGSEMGLPPPIGKKAYLQRFDIYPTQASLNKIDGSDLFVLASYFGDSCP